MNKRLILGWKTLACCRPDTREKSFLSQVWSRAGMVRKVWKVMVQLQVFVTLKGIPRHSWKALINLEFDFSIFHASKYMEGRGKKDWRKFSFFRLFMPRSLNVSFFFSMLVSFLSSLNFFLFSELFFAFPSFCIFVFPSSCYFFPLLCLVSFVLSFFCCLLIPSLCPASLFFLVSFFFFSFILSILLLFPASVSNHKYLINFWIVLVPEFLSDWKFW